MFFLFFKTSFNALGVQWLCVLYQTVNTTVKNMGAGSSFFQRMKKKKERG